MKPIVRFVVFGLIGVFFAAGPCAVAGSHTWDVWEVFSNADVTVQFIELHEANGTNFEVGLGGHLMVAHPTGTTFTITHSVAAPTALKSFLLATAAFAALPGAPTPDDIIPANFITIANEAAPRCEHCAVAIITDTECPVCNIRYKDGNVVPRTP